MYKIWVARNKLIFEHKATTAQDTISAIRSAREWQAAQQEETRAATSLATASGTPRSCPPDTVTVNYYASWHNDSSVAALGWFLASFRGAVKSDAHCV
ncbi:hypothetical protein Bca101_028527 [Brassica carinata]